MRGDRAELASQGAALAFTLCLVILATRRDIFPPERLPVEAPKPTQVTLSVVEEPPPPPPPPPVAQPPQPLPPPELPPPPPQVTPSLLPPPPPPRPRHLVLRHRHPPPRPIPQTPVPPPVTQPQSPAAPRPPSQAPENHSADAAYVGQLHDRVEANTRAPDSPAFRLAHVGGEVTIAFVLQRSGAVSDVHVLRSSGSSLIDRQGVLIVAGTRYPPMPADVFPGQSSHPFTVPVRILPPPATGDL